MNILHLGIQFNIEPKTKEHCVDNSSANKVSVPELLKTTLTGTITSSDLNEWYKQLGEEIQNALKLDRDEAIDKLMGLVSYKVLGKSTQDELFEQYKKDKEKNIHREKFLKASSNSAVIKESNISGNLFVVKADYLPRGFYAIARNPAYHECEELNLDHLEPNDLRALADFMEQSDFEIQTSDNDDSHEDSDVDNLSSSKFFDENRFEDIWIDKNINLKDETLIALKDDDYINYISWKGANQVEMYKKHKPGIKVVIGDSDHLIFNGNCLDCSSQKIHGVDRCRGCECFRGDWGKPDLFLEQISNDGS